MKKKIISMIPIGIIAATIIAGCGQKKEYIENTLPSDSFETTKNTNIQTTENTIPEETSSVINTETTVNTETENTNQTATTEEIPYLGEKEVPEPPEPEPEEVPTDPSVKETKASLISVNENTVVIEVSNAHYETLGFIADNFLGSKEGQIIDQESITAEYNSFAVPKNTKVRYTITYKEKPDRISVSPITNINGDKDDPNTPPPAELYWLLTVN